MNILLKWKLQIEKFQDPTIWTKLINKHGFFQNFLVNL